MLRVDSTTRLALLHTELKHKSDIEERGLGSFDETAIGRWNQPWTRQSRVQDPLITAGIVAKDHSWRNLQDVDKCKEKEGRAKNHAKSGPPSINEREPRRSDLKSQTDTDTDDDDDDPFAVTPTFPLLQIPEVPSTPPALVTRPLPLVPPILPSSNKAQPQPKRAKPQAEGMTAKLGYFKGTGENEDARTWIQDFEYKMDDAEWDDTKAAKMFARLMREGTPAETWFTGLNAKTQAEYTEIRKAFDSRLPPKIRVAQSTKLMCCGRRS